MQINGNGQFIYNNRKNSCGTNLLKLPAKKLNVQSRNVNNYGNNIFQSNNIQKNSLYSTKEATPRKEYKTVLNTGKKIQEKIDPLDDSLDQISEILKTNKKVWNYSELVGKIPGISNEPNFVFDQILYNKSKINKAKKIAQKIGVLKFPITNINNMSTKETLSNSDRAKGKQCFSERMKRVIDNNNIKEKKKEDDSAEISCCFFGRK